MPALEDLATTIQTLSDGIQAVDTDTAISAVDGVAEQAVAFGSSESIAAPAGVKESLESIGGT